MAKINRKYIDKHWGVFVARGILAGIFGFLLLFIDGYSRFRERTL